MRPLQDGLASAKFAELRQRPGARYVVVGGTTYALEIAVILIAHHDGVGPILSVALSYGVGLLVSFTLQKLFTFGDRRTHHKVVLPQITAFSALVAFNFGFTLGVTQLLQHDMPLVVVRTLALGITTIWNFYLYKTRIFRVPLVD